MCILLNYYITLTIFLNYNFSEDISLLSIPFLISHPGKLYRFVLNKTLWPSLKNKKHTSIDHCKNFSLTIIYLKRNDEVFQAFINWPFYLLDIFIIKDLLSI